MARPKKSEEKAKEPESSQISRDDFIRTRDSVVTGLTSLQAAVQDLARAYIDHTDTVLGRKGEGLSLAQFNLSTKPLGGDGGFFSARAPTPAPIPEVSVEGKKRKRAPHDKNAPKRALTPFFLYLQSERANIGSQLGDNHTAKEVQDEGGRRWREMRDEEKSKWQDEYGVNFARYQEHTKAYKAGQPLPVISDAEAKRLYEKNKSEKAGKLNKTQTPVVVAEAALVEEDDDDEDDDTSSDEETPEPPKQPTPPPAKKQKTSKESAKKKVVAPRVDEPTLDPQLRGGAVPAPAPEKKKKKINKKDKDTAAVTAVGGPPVLPAPKPTEEAKPKKKGRKHKTLETEA